MMYAAELFCYLGSSETDVNNQSFGNIATSTELHAILEFLAFNTKLPIKDFTAVKNFLQ